MLSWIKKKLKIEDVDFNLMMPFGQCEAGLGWHAGMKITCGTKTNMRDRGYWVCSRHPVPAGTRSKEVLA